MLLIRKVCTSTYMYISKRIRISNSIINFTENSVLTYFSFVNENSLE